MQRAAAIEAGQIEFVVDAERLQHLLVGEIVDPQHHVFEVRAELLGQARDRLLCQPLDLVRVRRVGLTHSHSCAPSTACRASGNQFCNPDAHG
jgi:hypothetical protein